MSKANVDVPTQSSTRGGSAPKPSTTTSSSSRRTLSKGNHKNLAVTVEGLTVIIVKGNISEQTVEGLVNSVGGHMDMTAGAISQSILKKAGPGIQTELTKNKPGDIHYGQVVVTEGHNLSAKWVFHGVLKRWDSGKGDSEKIVRSFATSVLTEASKKGVKSIAFPAVGTGILAFPADLVATVLFDVVDNFSMKNPVSSVTEVHFVIYEKDLNVWSAFETKMSELSKAPATTNTVYTPAMLITDKGPKVPSQVNAARLTRGAPPPRPIPQKPGKIHDEQQATDASVSIKEPTATVIANGSVPTKPLVQAQKSDNLKIKSVENKAEVTALAAPPNLPNIPTMETGKKTVRKNDKKDKKKRKGELTKDDIGTPTDFRHVGHVGFDPAKGWDMDYLDPDLKGVFDKLGLYEKELQDKDTAQFMYDSIEIHGGIEAVKEQSRQQLHPMVNTRPVAPPQPPSSVGHAQSLPPAPYAAQAGIKVPDNWSPVDPLDPYRKVKLDETSAEYKAVEKNVRETCTNKIVKIERIENYFLYDYYQLAKSHMSKNCGSEVEAERQLWHGTAEDALKNIFVGGFNRSYCGKNATLLGQGVYFAKNFSYSAQLTYSPPNGDGDRFIFQCRVLTGYTTNGDPDMKEPPMRTRWHRYDSVTDDVDDPAIFVVFKDSLAYPEYLVTFK